MSKYTREDWANSKIYKKLLLSNEIKLTFYYKYKTCQICQNDKELNTDNFYLRIIIFNGSNYIPNFGSYCKECLCKKQKEKGKNYNKKIFEKETNIRRCNKCKINKKLNEGHFRINSSNNYKNICLICECESVRYKYHYIKNNDNKLYLKQLKTKKEYIRNKLKNNPAYKLRKNASRLINIALKENGSSKRGHSILEYLPYSFKELKEHIEKQFQEKNNEWMNWNNWGNYRVKIWDDNDSTTWTWQLDHIIPQCKLPYTSMEEENFKKCWSLENLRPLSAKKNVIEGSRLKQRRKKT